LAKGLPVTVAEEGFKIFGTGRTIGNADLQDSIVRLPCGLHPRR